MAAVLLSWNKYRTEVALEKHSEESLLSASKSTNRQICFSK